jgi:hypothetical protein
MKAKHVLLFFIAALTLLFVVPALFSFAEEAGNPAMEAENLPAGSPNYEVYFANGSTNSVGTDSFVNTEIDTLNIPSLLLSNWNYNVTIRGTAHTGTRSLIVILEESNERTGAVTATHWYEVERDTAGTGTGIMKLNGDHVSVATAMVGKVRGVRQRIRLVGTGTQKSTYLLRCVYKKD